MVLGMEPQDLPTQQASVPVLRDSPSPPKNTVLGATEMDQWEKVFVAKSEELSSVPRINIIKNQLHNVVPFVFRTHTMANVHTHTHTMKYQWANPWQTHSPPLSYTPGSQITLYKGPVQVILWFHKQSERRWTRKQSQHITFFTRPQTQVRKLCVIWNVYLPQPHLRGAWHNWLTPSVYLRAFISVCCFENWPRVTLNHCMCVLGRLPRVCVYLPGLVNLYTTDPACNTYTLWRSKSCKFMVLWTRTTSGRDDVETELWEEVRLGRATDTEAMTRGHKVKWLNTICNSTCK